jgi:uncharacterized protein YjhX (UPF0386 family)
MRFLVDHFVTSQPDTSSNGRSSVDVCADRYCRGQGISVECFTRQGFMPSHTPIRKYSRVRRNSLEMQLVCHCVYRVHYAVIRAEMFTADDVLRQLD